MATPDVRVRLSAEGVAEVIAALRNIRNETARTQKASSGGFGGFLSAVGNVRTALVGLAGVLGAAGFTSFIKSSADAAEQLLNTSKTIGATVANTQALAVASSRAGVDVASLASSLGTFARTSTDALRGDPEAQGLFRALNLTRKEIESFRGQDTVQRLKVVADSYVKLKDGSEKAAAGAALVKKGFAALIPVIDELGGKELPRLDFTASAETLRAADALGDSLGDVQRQVGQLAIQFVSGLAPSGTAAFKAIGGELSAGAKGWQIFGEMVGTVLGGLSVGFVALGDIIHTALTTLVANAISLGKALGAALTGNFDEAQFHLQAARLRSENEQRALEERLDKLDKRFRDRTPPSVGTTQTVAPPNPDELLKRRLDIQRAMIDKELAIAKAGAKLREDQEQRSFDLGLTNLREFYEARRKIAVDGINAEIVALQRRRVLIDRDPTVKNKPAELIKADTAIEQLVNERTAKLEELTAREASDYRALAAQRLDLDRRVFEARGNQLDAELLQMAEEIKKADELLFKSGAAEEDARRTLDSLSNSLGAQAQFNQLQRTANDRLSGFERDRSRIQADVDAGLISQAVGEAEVLRLEKQRVAELKKIAAAMLEAAGTNPERIKQAEEFLERIRDIDREIRSSESFGAKALATAGNALQESLVRNLGEGEVAALKFSSVMKNVAMDVVQAVRRMITQFLVLRAVTGLLSLFGGKAAGIGGPGSGAGEEIPGIKVAALGGELPGVGTGDVNLGVINPGQAPLFFEAGEYLIPRPVVRQPGARQFLEAFRHHGMAALSMPRLMSPLSHAFPRFADGGMLGDSLATPAPAAAASATIDGFIKVGAEPGLVIREIRSPAGRRGFLQFVGENSDAINQILNSRR